MIADISAMHKNFITHGDAHAGNILVKGEKLFWSDFDKMKKGRLYLTLGGRQYDLYKTLRSIVSPLVAAGLWSRESSRTVRQALDCEYPGYAGLKKKVYKKIKSMHKEFEY